MISVKKVIAILVALSLITAFSVSAYAQGYPSFNNFKKIETFTDNQFSDVSKDAWYFSNVKQAFELGLMKGSTDSFFNTNGNVTIAEAITMSARLHSIYNTGEDEFKQSTPWYQTYVDYAIENSIITTAFEDYNKPATRDEFAYILANSLPDTALWSMNKVEDGAIPDVSMSQDYADSIYKLYLIYN